MKYFQSGYLRTLAFLFIAVSFLGLLMVYVDNYRSNRIQVITNSINTKIETNKLLLESYSKSVEIQNSLYLKFSEPIKNQLFHYEKRIEPSGKLHIVSKNRIYTSFMSQDINQMEFPDINNSVLKNKKIYITKPITRNRMLLGKLYLQIPLKNFQSTITEELGIPFYFQILKENCNISTEKCLQVNLKASAYSSILILGFILSGIFFFSIFILIGLQVNAAILEKEKDLLSEKLYIAKMVKHDIRSPLMALQVFLEDLDINSEKKNFIQNISQRIQQITNSLISLEEYSADQIKDRKVFLIDLLQNIVKEKELESKKIGKDILFEIVFFNDEVIVKGNEEILYRILSNLINNAIHSIDYIGEIQIKIWSKKSMAHIEILDSGKGIAKDKLAKVFEYGFSDFEKGTGLGLFNARRELEQVGGKVQLSSEIGKGTKVKISMRAS